MKPDLLKPLFFSVLIACLFGFNRLLAQSIPIANAGSNVSFCEGQGPAQLNGSATSGTPPYYYTWWCDTTVCVIDSINDDDPLVNPSTTTVYYLQVTDFNGMVSSIDSVVVTVLPTPVVDGGPDHEICSDNAPCVILTPSIFNAPGPYTYNWGPTTGINSAMILNPCARPMVTTVYGLQATSSNGCSNGLPGTDSLAMVTVAVMPQPIANAAPDRFLCEGDSIQLNGFGTNAGPLYFFSWSPTSGLSNSSIPSPMASPSVSTTYTLTVWSNGCPSVGQTVFVSVFPVPSPLSITQIADTLFASPADSGNTYSWCLNGQVIGGAQDSFLVFNSNGTYEAKQVNNWGCPSASSNTIVGLQNGLQPPAVQVFPNPFSTTFSLDLKGGWGNLEIHLMDVQGRILWKRDEVAKGRMELDFGEGLPSGLYFLQVKHEDALISNKLIIKE